MYSTSEHVTPLILRHVLGRLHLGLDLTRSENGGDETLFKAFWHHTDAILCCAWKVLGEVYTIDCDIFRGKQNCNCSEVHLGSVRMSIRCSN